MSFDLKAKVCKDIGPYSRKEIRFYFPYEGKDRVLFRMIINDNTKIHDIITYCKFELKNPKIIFKLLSIDVEFSNCDFENFIKSFMKYLADEDRFNYSGLIEFPWHYDVDNFTYEYTLNPVILS